MTGTKDFQKMVRDFNQATNSPKDKDLRIRLIREEAKETYDAIKRHDAIETIDGICDLLYVTYGAADCFGVTLDTRQVEEMPPEKPGFPDWPMMNFELPDFSSAVNCAIKALDAVTNEVSYRSGIQAELTCLAEGLWMCAAKGLNVTLQPFFREVHRTNMHKLKGPKREDGKQLKPEGWKPPRIRAMYHSWIMNKPLTCEADCTNPETYDVSLRVPHIDGGYCCAKCGGFFVGVE